MIETLKMIQSGKTLQEISAERGLVISTVETHCARLIGEGKLDIYKIFPKNKVDYIHESMVNLQSTSVSYLKERLGSDYSFGEIRAVVAHAEFQKTIQ